MPGDGPIALEWGMGQGLLPTEAQSQGTGGGLPLLVLAPPPLRHPPLLDSGSNGPYKESHLLALDVA